MTHEWKKITAGALAVFVLATCLAGCNVNAQTPDPTDPTDPTEPSVTQVTDNATDPTTEPTTEPSKPDPTPGIDRPIGPTVLGTAELKQLRLGGYDGNWTAAFGNTLGEFVVVKDYDALVNVFTAINGMGRNINFPGEFDSDFFAENYVVLIPRGSSSGSVQYVADAVRGIDKITITVEGRMPEVGTTDMADWLLLVTLPRDQFPEDMTIEVKGPENQGVDIRDDLNITDR